MSRFAVLGLSPLVLAASVSAQTSGTAMDHSAHQGHDMSTMQMPAPDAPPEPSDPHAGHDMEGMEGMEGMTMPDAPAETAPDTAADHANAGEPTGTDQAPGNAPPPPVASDRPADRFYDPAAMAEAQAAPLRRPARPVFFKYPLHHPPN